MSPQRTKYQGAKLRYWISTSVLLILATLGVVSGPAVAQQDSADDTERNLRQLRERIEALKQEVGEAVVNRTSAEQSLRDIEVAESGVRNRLLTVRKDLQETRARQTELADLVALASADLAAQKIVLARQMRLAWVTGREEWVRLLLSQQNPTDAGRRMVYYGYITRDRSDVIDGVLEKMQQLEKVSSSLATEQERLQELESNERKRLGQLEATRKMRNDALSLINASIVSSGDKLERLVAQEQEMQALLARLSRNAMEMPGFEGLPFREMKGRFNWPADGRLLKNYGDSRADGQMRWNGVLMTTEAGSEVRAVYYGRVVYSDWLPGMGLLIVIEHGDGYISLYGHNQDLTRNVGQWVGPGDVIAHVGDSGGQGVTGLYFEIRKDGEPINPNAWIR